MTTLNERILVSSLLMVVLTFAVSSSAQTYAELYSFDGDIAAAPVTALTQGVDGNLYGETRYGGTGGCFDGNGIGCGVVFGITRGGGFEILHSFQQSEGIYYPQNDLALGPDGNLYGTTNIPQSAIFRVTRDGTLTTIHVFTGPDGYGLYGGLTLGTDGNFYGTTGGGGKPSDYCPGGCGTVFRMTPAGLVTTLYSFCQENYCPDGRGPGGHLAEGTDGNFYGTASSGGLYKAGTIFRITPSGSFKLLYTDNEGHGPGLILATDGSFYGIGSSYLYRITPTGIYTQLSSPGSNPQLPIEGSDRNLYGTTTTGAFGNVFEMSLSGSTTTLHNFAGYPTDGSEPYGGLVQYTNGIFYGATFSGGSSPCNYSRPGCGTIFSVDTGLPPFVAFLRGGGRVGRRFGVLGQGFTGTTSVSLNGTPASFVVKADTFLMATVPAGATTGYVTVNTPSGTLTSNVPYYVKP